MKFLYLTFWVLNSASTALAQSDVNRSDRVLSQVQSACQKLVEMYQVCPLFHRVSGVDGPVASCAERLGAPSYLESSVSIGGGEGLRLALQGPGSQVLYSQKLSNGSQTVVWHDENGRVQPLSFPWLLTRMIWLEGESVSQAKNIVMRVGERFVIDQWVVEGDRLYSILAEMKNLRESSVCRVEDDVIEEVLERGF
ncbi:MAG: hypothetical protein AB8C84_03940 [Oligoflexales bacterium]